MFYSSLSGKKNKSVYFKKLNIGGGKKKKNLVFLKETLTFAPCSDWEVLSVQ